MSPTSGMLSISLPETECLKVLSNVMHILSCGLVDIGPIAYPIIFFQDDSLAKMSWSGARKPSWGVSGLELPSKIYELKCYKMKLLNLFSNYKPNVFRCRSSIEKQFSSTKVSTSWKDICGSGGLPPEKNFSVLTCS